MRVLLVSAPARQLVRADGLGLPDFAGSPLTDRSLAEHEQLAQSRVQPRPSCAEDEGRDTIGVRRLCHTSEDMRRGAHGFHL